jgi:D-glycero-D-manno-heptose 1,7-bisphosphate phosphatase
MSISAVLFDRDGTLIVDVPHNADPAKVVPMPTAKHAVQLVRNAGLPIGVVTNQSTVGRGDATLAEVDATNRRVEELLGPLGTFYVCPHAPWDGCSCRKPLPGLLIQAAEALGVSPTSLVLIGDKGSDMGAAIAVGATAILVPSHDTPRTDIDHAPHLAPTLLAAVESVLAREQ